MSKRFQSPSEHTYPRATCRFCFRLRENQCLTCERAARTKPLCAHTPLPTSPWTLPCRTLAREDRRNKIKRGRKRCGKCWDQFLWSSTVPSRRHGTCGSCSPAEEVGRREKMSSLIEPNRRTSAAGPGRHPPRAVTCPFGSQR